MADLHLLSPKGFKAGAVAAKIKKSGKLDVALLVSEQVSSAAAVFTTNKVFAAPVKIGREHIVNGTLQAIVVNAGCANACTGARGERDARTMCKLTAKLVGCGATDVLPSSTGIIGHHLPMEKLESGINGAFAGLGTSQEHALLFSDAILTTDLVRKTAGVRVKIGKEFVTLAGVCKGSGMIGPKMSPPQATMLAYLTTDAKVDAKILQKLMNSACDASFNAVTVDDHCSTNDTAVLMASGASGVKISSSADIAKFKAALDEVAQSLAYQIAADGEGATKVVRINISGATSDSDAYSIARSIANSPLVKCAMHGNDPNWGRIVSAAGMCGAQFDPDKAVLKLQGHAVFRKGSPVPFDAKVVSTALKAKEVIVDLACNIGKSNSTCWTCDLSKDYVSINADYST